MSNSEIGSIALTLCVFIGLAHTLGFVFERLRQPRVIGEILAGVLLGPFVLGAFGPDLFARILGVPLSGPNKTDIILNFIYWIGLFLLMFISGSETRRLMARENQAQTAWLLGLGISIPFLFVLGLGLASLLPLHMVVGTAGQEMATLLILAIAVAVTSIPVISRIFYDLGILQTRFASLVLGTAVLEDIVLWGVLAVATGIVKSAGMGSEMAGSIALHTLTTVGYMAFGLGVAPALLRCLHSARLNLLMKASPRGYIFVILFAYIAVASVLDVNLVFGAFLAGFGLIGGIKGGERDRFAESP